MIFPSLSIPPYFKKNFNIKNMFNYFFASFSSSFKEMDDFKAVNCDSHMPQGNRRIIGHGNLHKQNT